MYFIIHRNMFSSLLLQVDFTAFLPTLPTHNSPNRETSSYLTSLKSLKSPKTLELWMTTFLVGVHNRRQLWYISEPGQPFWSSLYCIAGYWVNKALNMTSPWIAGSTSLTRSDFTLNLLLLQGKGCEVVDNFNNSVLCHL